MATATLSRSKHVTEEIAYFVLSHNRRQKTKGVFFVADSKNPDAGDRVKIMEEFPKKQYVPTTDEIIDPITGNAVQIRHIKGCPYLKVEDQKKHKFLPRHNADKIILIDGGIAVDAKRQPELLAYLRATNRNITNPDRDPNRVAIIMEMDFDAEKLNNLKVKYDNARAIMRIEEMGLEDAKNLVYKYGFVHDSEAGEGSFKEILLDIAEENPKFILEGIKDQNDRRKVLARKAVEEGFITLTTPATVCWQQNGEVKSVICNVGDLGGEVGKFDRFVSFLASAEGTHVVNRIAELVGNVEIGDLTGESITDTPELSNTYIGANAIMKEQHELSLKNEPEEEEGEENEEETPKRKYKKRRKSRK
jgi:hypothetical protein